MTPPPLRLPRRRAALLAVLALAGAGCAADRIPVRTSFPPLRYDYLTPLRLNVSAVEVREEAPPVPSLSPFQPVQALRTMAEDRLAAGGSTGRAVFTIQQAAIVPERRGLSGTLAVRLDVLTPDGAQAAYTEARVSRRRTDGSGDPRGASYELLRQMMDDMNVEFEFQVRRSLRDWLQATAPNAPAPQPVEQQDLPPPS